jgi:hypothetical protein
MSIPVVGSLPLAAGHRVKRPVFHAAEPAPLELVVGDLSLLRRDAPAEPDAGEPSHDDHVDGGERERPVELRALRHVAEARRAPHRVIDPPRDGRDEAEHRADDGRLAGAVRPHDAQERLSPDRQVDGRQDAAPVVTHLHAAKRQ